MKFGVGTPTVCASPPGGRFSPPEPVPTLGPVRGMGPTSEAKWEGWSEAEGLRRESSRPSGGRVDVRSAGEQPYAWRKSGHTFSERAAVRPEEVLPTQRARLSAGRMRTRMRTRVRTRVQTWAQASWCRPGCESGCEPGCRPAVRAENENRAALLVRPALIFGWLHLSQQMCVLKVVISSPHRTLHTSHI